MCPHLASFPSERGVPKGSVAGMDRDHTTLVICHAWTERLVWKTLSYAEVE